MSRLVYFDWIVVVMLVGLKVGVPSCWRHGVRSEPWLGSLFRACQYVSKIRAGVVDESGVAYLSSVAEIRLQ